MHRIIIPYFYIIYEIKEPPEGVGTTGGSLNPLSPPSEASVTHKIMYCASAAGAESFGLTLYGTDPYEKGSPRSTWGVLKGLVCFRAHIIRPRRKAQDKWRVTT